MGRAFRVLGPLEVSDDEGRHFELGGPRQRAVLALLLLRAGEVVPTDHLLEAIWADRQPDKAVNVLQSYVSKLRRELGRNVIATRGRGYAVQVEPDELDLHRFERMVAQADLEDPASAATSLREALALWRGPALADFTGELWALGPAGRLEELRVAALEKRVDADLSLGRHRDVIGEIDALVSQHPFRERLRAQQMLALYRSDRQADALEAYRAARRTLVDELGIEPSRGLQELESAILRQDPSLGLPRAAEAVAMAPGRGGRSILVAPRRDASILPLCSIAEPLAARPPRDLIVVRLVEPETELDSTTAHLAGLRDELVSRGLEMRVAAYTSAAPGEDVALLAKEQDVDLVLVDAARELMEDGVFDRDLATILQDSPCDVAVLIPSGSFHRETARPVVVPFGGGDDDWSAVEIAAWVARALGTKLRLVGTSADRFRHRRDASRLLARVSLIVQAVVGIVAEPVLVRGGPDGVLDAAAEASLLVVGLSGRWQAEGLGAARLELARRADVSTLLVRRGFRPGGLAPKESMTRFTWTIGP